MSDSTGQYVPPENWSNNPYRRQEQLAEKFRAAHTREIHADYLTSVPEVQVTSVGYEPSGFQIVLETIKNVLVIITCLAILVSLFQAYVWLNDVQAALQSWGDNLSNGLFGE